MIYNMNVFYTVILTFSVILKCHITNSQLPPRFNVPGAVLVSRPGGFRQARIQGDGPPPRLRRPPIPNAAPVPIRPVVEEPEEPPASPAPSNFDDEVSQLGISVLQSAVRQAVIPEEEPPRPVHFRPERPVPVLRQDIRENIPSPRPTPVRQEQRENIPRALIRQEERENIPVPLRQPQPVRHSQPRQHIVPTQPPPPVRQPTRGHHPSPARQPSQYLDEENGRQGRKRKPVVQILKKYRTDNADGSITWGFENEDGTFKEETLGVDCVTRGKYGYVDPDGVRREYTYETGNKCDEPEEEDEDLVLQNRPQQPQLQSRNKPQPQYRPLPQQI